MAELHHRSGYFSLVAVALVMVLTLAGCREPADDPELQAIESNAARLGEALIAQDGEIIAGLLCPDSESGNASESFLYLWSVGLALKSGDLEPEALDYEISYNATWQNETAADVSITGRLTITPEMRQNAVHMPLPEDDAWQFDDVWRFTSDGQEWLWCGTVTGE